MASSNPSIQLEKIIAAAPTQVFAAWTQPTQIAKWWGAGNQCETFLNEVDLRVGGRYRFGMRSPAGEEYIAGGEYQEIITSQKLVFTWLWEHSPEDHPISRVTIEFKPHDSGCHLLLTHEQLAAEQIETHAEGWQNALNYIATLLS